MTREKGLIVAAALLLTDCDRVRDAIDSLREGSESAVVETVDAALPTFEFTDPSPDQIELHAAAVTALRDGRTDEAMAALLALRDTTAPSELRATGVLLLADRYFAESRFTDCLAALDALAAASPPQAALEFLRGRTLVELERDADAEEALRRAIRLDTDFLRPYAVLAVLLSSNGRQDEARDLMLQHDRAVARIADRLRPGHALEDRMGAVTALRHGWRDDSVSLALEAGLDDPSPEVRAATIAALTDVGTAIALPTLQSHVDGIDDNLREPLLSLIAGFGGTVPEAPPP